MRRSIAWIVACTLGVWACGDAATHATGGGPALPACSSAQEAQCVASNDAGPDSGGAGTRDAAADTGSADGCAPPCRDFQRDPAVAVVPHASELLAVSDVHGGYDRLVALFARYGLLAAVPGSPSAASWAGGTRVLVVVGDLFDKGPKGLEVIELLQALEASALAQGGRVITLLGNHEAELFADPNNSKATASDGIAAELATLGISTADFASGKDARGAWLLRRPVAAMVGKWFFAHAGNTHGMAAMDLEAFYEGAILAGYADPRLTGADSILESRGWYTGTTAQDYANALGALHIVFGHDPNAIGSKGKMGTASNGVLFRIDCGMSPDVDYSQGAILRVRVDGTNDVAESLGADGTVTPLWTGPTGL